MEMIDFNAKKGFLCDMDGVIYHGNHILPGAAEFIHWLQDTHKEYLFLTNNSGMTPRELHQKLGHIRMPSITCPARRWPRRPSWPTRRPGARCTRSARRGCSTRCMTAVSP